MLREERRLLVEPALVQLLERARHRGVRARAPLAQLRAERDLLRERVLEGVLGDGVERRLVDELGASQRCERVAQLRVGEPCHARQHGLAELLADHGRGLEQLLLALGQPVDARGQHGLHARGNFELLERVTSRYDPRSPAS